MGGTRAGPVPAHVHSQRPTAAALPALPCHAPRRLQALITFLYVDFLDATGTVSPRRAFHLARPCLPPSQGHPPRPDGTAGCRCRCRCAMPCAVPCCAVLCRAVLCHAVHDVPRCAMLCCAPPQLFSMANFVNLYVPGFLNKKNKRFPRHAPPATHAAPRPAAHIPGRRLRAPASPCTPAPTAPPRAPLLAGEESQRMAWPACLAARLLLPHPTHTPALSPSSPALRMSPHPTPPHPTAGRRAPSAWMAPPSP